MSEIFADPLLPDEQVPRREIQDMITAAPGAARGLVTLFQAYRKVRDELEATTGDGGIRQMSNPIKKVRATLQQSNNHFPILEDAANELRRKAKIESISDFGLTADNTLASIAAQVFRLMLFYNQP